VQLYSSLDLVFACERKIIGEFVEFIYALEYGPKGLAGIVLFNANCTEPVFSPFPKKKRRSVLSFSRKTQKTHT